MATEFTPNYRFAKPDFNVSPWHDDVNGNFDLLDAIIFAFSGVGNIKGEWANDTVYTQGDRVIDDIDLSMWQAQVSHTSATAPTTFAQDRAANPTYWTAISTTFDNVGAWQTATNYSANEFLTDAGRYGVVTGSYTSGASYSADVANGNIITLIDVSQVVHRDGSLPMTGDLNVNGNDIVGAVSVEATGSVTTDALTVNTINGSPMSAYRNKIINGNFIVWQRSTTQTTSGYGSDDRWVNENTGSTKTHSLQNFALGQTDVPGNDYYFSRTVVSSVAGAANYVSKYQAIEGVRTFSGKQVTITFWAKADTNKNIAIELLQRFGVGGTPSTQVSIPLGLKALTSSWQKFSFTANVPSIAGKTIGTIDDSISFLFWFDAGSNYNTRASNLGQQSGTFDVSHISIVEGDATQEDDPFTPRAIPQEIDLCQYYYQRLPLAFHFNFSAQGATPIGWWFNWARVMRKTPILGWNIAGATLNNVSSINFDSVTQYGYRGYVVVVGAGPGNVATSPISHWIEGNAEL